MLVTADCEGNTQELSVDAVAALQTPILTYDARTVVDLLRQNRRDLPNQLVDIGDALKIESGASRDDGGEPHWDVWAALKPFFPLPDDHAAITGLTEARTPYPESQEIYRLLASAARALHELWTVTEWTLRLKQEYQRFTEIEVPIQQIFHARQHAGIHLDGAALAATLDRVRNEKYTAFRQIAGVLNMSPSGLSFRNIGPYLTQTDASHLQEFAEQANFEDYFKIAQHTSSFAAVFLQFIRASRDLTILTGTTGGDNIIYPEFNCFGTVTGRVLVTNPRLQELRRKHRIIVSAEPGKTLVYLDYSQFEPGIIASLSDDQQLRDAYQATDLYTALSEAIFSSKGHRAVCKQVFLAYCFGMSIDNIAKLLAGSDFSLERLVLYRDAVTEFFRRFAGLASYRQRMQDQLETNGFASSLMGNRRVRRAAGPLTNKERRWALNHIIQATASLIFKRALIVLAERFGNASIVLPMHDAVLLQLDNASLPKATAEAMSLMKDAFSTYCPNVTPRIANTAFAQE